jgi:SOS-response transcriptional repressor LexA
MTSKQIDLLRFLADFTARHGFSPNYAEMCDALGTKSRGNMHNLVARLKLDGFVKQSRLHAARNLLVTDKGLAALGKLAPKDHFAVAALSDDELTFLATQVQAEVEARCCRILGRPA